MGMTSPAAWRGLIAAALLGAAAGFQPVLTMMQGAGASVGGRVAPRAPGFAAREACSSGLSAGARAAGPRAAARFLHARRHRRPCEAAPAASLPRGRG